MKIAPSVIAGVSLLQGPETDEFEQELIPLPGGAPRELMAPALPYSVILVNEIPRTRFRFSVCGSI